MTELEIEYSEFGKGSFLLLLYENRIFEAGFALTYS